MNQPLFAKVSQYYKLRPIESTKSARVFVKLLISPSTELHVLSLVANEPICGI